MSSWHPRPAAPRRARQRAFASPDANGASLTSIVAKEDTKQPPEAKDVATSSSSDESPQTTTGTLLVKCPDQKGVVAGLAQLLYGFGCNILSSDQFSDLQDDMFYQRIEFDYADIIVGPGNTGVLERGIAEVARKCVPPPPRARPLPPAGCAAATSPASLQVRHGLEAYY